MCPSAWSALNAGMSARRSKSSTVAPRATAVDDATEIAARFADRSWRLPHTVISRTPGCGWSCIEQSNTPSGEITPRPTDATERRRQRHGGTRRDLRSRRPLVRRRQCRAPHDGSFDRAISRSVVIGATGHVGSYLVPRLVRGRHEVVALSRAHASPTGRQRVALSGRRGAPGGGRCGRSSTVARCRRKSMRT
jgi:NAD dependent epimerase/dehydratase family